MLLSLISILSFVSPGNYSELSNKNCDMWLKWLLDPSRCDALQTVRLCMCTTVCVVCGAYIKDKHMPAAYTRVIIVDLRPFDCHHYFMNSPPLTNNGKHKITPLIKSHNPPMIHLQGSCYEASCSLRKPFSRQVPIILLIFMGSIISQGFDCKIIICQ